VDEDGSTRSLNMGRIASFYYLKHETMSVFTQRLRRGMAMPEVRRPAFPCVH
jgi:hypothetical protein